MATQNPISTISYNTETFLREKLETWIDAHIIQSYMYICHKGEDGDKDHIHLRVEPNKRLDPMDLSAQLMEYEIGKSKPLGVRTWRPSKEEDWILYAVHDKDYLETKYASDKGEKLPYKWEDIKAPETYDVEIAFIRAKAKLEHTTSNMTKRIQNGEMPVEMLLKGENPYIVNSVMNLLQNNDYTRLTKAYKELGIKYNMLVKAVEEKGLTIELDENGRMKLT